MKKSWAGLGLYVHILTCNDPKIFGFHYGDVNPLIGYGLDGLGIKSWWGARFPVPVQTGPGVHPGSCTMGTRSLSWG
jgi:hypothetical protein